MPFNDSGLDANPIVLALLMIGVRWVYGLITGHKAASFGALVLWGMVAAIIIYVLLLVVPWLADKIIPRSSPDKKE